MNKRRSERLLAQAAVIVLGRTKDRSSFIEPTRATIINAHGALISLTTPVALRHQLNLRNPATRQEEECFVVYLGGHQAGRTEIGVEFKNATPQFWALENPPESWKEFLPRLGNRTAGKRRP